MVKQEQGEWEKALDAGVIAGRFLERERIIALLEEKLCDIYGEFCRPDDDKRICWARAEVIALIKGEQS